MKTKNIIAMIEHELELRANETYDLGKTNMKDFLNIILLKVTELDEKAQLGQKLQDCLNQYGVVLVNRDEDSTYFVAWDETIIKKADQFDELVGHIKATRSIVKGLESGRSCVTLEDILKELEGTK